MTTQLTQDQMLAIIKQLQDDKAALTAKLAAPRRITLKVSAKGAMSLYGLGRWPVTLYKSQWQALLGQTKAIEEFMATNAALLADKPQA
jgi:hypothetical protein